MSLCHDSPCVGHRQSARDLNRDIERFGKPHLLDRHSLTERHAFDELHDDVAGAAFLTYFMNGNDVGMIQSRRSLCLALEAADALSVGGESRREQLQCDLALEP